MCTMIFSKSAQKDEASELWEGFRKGPGWREGVTGERWQARLDRAMPDASTGMQAEALRESGHRGL